MRSLSMRYAASSLLFVVLFLALLLNCVPLAQGQEDQASAGRQQAQANSNSLEQQPIAIRGNKALPKTLFIAPWKQLGSPLGSDPFAAPAAEQPVPLERDLFLKELEVYHDGVPAEDSW
ncbi:MAG: hypothetical protein V7707_07540 [Motiliproteus sp.]